MSFHSNMNADEPQPHQSTVRCVEKFNICVIFDWGLYWPSGHFVCVNYVQKLMGKKSPQAVCGSVHKFTKGSSSPLKAYLCRQKDFSFLSWTWISSNLIPTQPQRLANPNSLTVLFFFLFQKKWWGEERGDSGRPGMRQFVWCECVFCVITVSGWAPMLAW